jgi:hypothetical protein
MSGVNRFFESPNGGDVPVSYEKPFPVTTMFGAGSASTTAARLPSSAATNNATVVKASAGAIYSVNGYNADAAPIYLKFYDKATAPTVGTDTPVLTYALPATSAFSFPVPFGFATGIGFGLVTGAADADNTAVGAGDVLGLSIVYG